MHCIGYRFLLIVHIQYVYDVQCRHCTYVESIELERTFSLAMWLSQSRRFTYMISID